MMVMSGKWVDAVRQARPIEKLILDQDSSVSELYGQFPHRVNACRPPGKWQDYDIIRVGRSLTATT